MELLEEQELPDVSSILLLEDELALLHNLLLLSHKPYALLWLLFLLLQVLLAQLFGLLLLL